MTRSPTAPVVVVRGGAVGDFILTLPAISALRRARPRQPLWVIGHPERARLARADRILDADGPGLLPLFSPAAPADPGPLRGAALVLAYIPGATPCLAGRLQALTGGEVWLADPRPPAHYGGHMVDHLLAPLHRRQVPVADSRPRLELAAEDLRRAAAPLLDEGDAAAPLVCLHPGSGGAVKCWPASRYSGLAAGLLEAGWRCAVVLGPAEEERLPQLETALPTGAAVVRPPNLVALAGLLARAVLFVGNDSGPGHLAAAVGTPTLSLFGPTEPRLWAPRSPTGRVLRAPGGDLPGLDLDLVLRTALDMLEAQGEPQPEC